MPIYAPPSPQVAWPQHSQLILCQRHSLNLSSRSFDENILVCFCKYICSNSLFFAGAPLKKIVTFEILGKFELCTTALPLIGILEIRLSFNIFAGTMKPTWGAIIPKLL